MIGCACRLILAAGAYSAVQQAAAGNSCLTSDNTWPTPVLGATGETIANSAPSGISATPTGTFEFDTQGRLAASPGTSITVGARQITIDAGSGYVQVL